VNRPRKWVSAHLYFDGDLFGAPGDRVVRSVVSPLMATVRENGLARQTFFIRYSDPDPHVRLRILPRSASAARRVVRLVERRWAGLPARTTNGLRAAAMRWIAYEPELPRYGGPHAISIVEALFNSSSVVACRCLTPAVSRDRGERLGHGLSVAIVFLHAFLGDEARMAAFATRKAENYMHWPGMVLARRQRRDLVRTARRLATVQGAAIRSLLDCMKTGERLPKPLGDFRRETIAARGRLLRICSSGRLQIGGKVAGEWLPAAEALALSLLHMTHNRLGVTRLEEALLVSVLRELER
jgi:thiopeptide-type bacteriocin biosynthesis protein